MKSKPSVLFRERARIIKSETKLAPLIKEAMLSLAIYLEYDLLPQVQEIQEMKYLALLDKYKTQIWDDEVHNSQIVGEIIKSWNLT